MTTLDYNLIATLLEQEARIKEQEARIKLELAQAFRKQAIEPGTERHPAFPLNLGSLQLAVFDVLLTADETGFSPRELARQLRREDEPNVRSALERMRKQGITELVDGFGTQRWQLTVTYRQSENRDSEPM